LLGSGSGKVEEKSSKSSLNVPALLLAGLKDISLLSRSLVLFLVCFIRF